MALVAGQWSSVICGDDLWRSPVAATVSAASRDLMYVTTFNCFSFFFFLSLCCIFSKYSRLIFC